MCVLSCVDVIPSFTYVLRVVILTSLNDVVREGARDRKREAILTASRRYHQIKIQYNQEPLAVARLLFLTSNLQLPPTVYINNGYL